MSWNQSVRHASCLLLACLCTSGLFGARDLLAQTSAHPRGEENTHPASRREKAIRPTLEQDLAQAQAAQTASNFAEAAALYAKATRLDPGIAELWANRGLMEHLAHQPDAALVSFGRALQLNPDLFTPLLFSAQDEIALGKAELALPLLKRAATQQPQNPDISVAFAHAYAALGQQREAAAAYQQATQLQPGNAAAWYGLAVASLSNIETDGAALARAHTGSVWAQALYADELLTQGRLTEGTRLYTELSEKAAPQDRCKLAQVLEDRESDAPGALPTDTRSAIGKALHANSDDCRCAADASNHDSCTHLESVPAIHGQPSLQAGPGTPEALYWSIKSNEQQAALALARFEDLSPHSPATFDLTGDLYRRRSLPDRARAEYQKALSIDPRDPAALLGSAAASLSESHPEEALAFAKRGLADRPDDPKLNLVTAQALVSQHHFEDAVPFLQTCLRSHAESPALAHALMGRVAAARGETQTAIREIRLGLSVDQDGSLHYQLFRLLRETGDVAGAKAAEAQARDLVQQRLAHATTALKNMQETSTNDSE